MRSLLMGASPVGTDSRAATGPPCWTQRGAGPRTCRFPPPRSSPTFERRGTVWRSSAPVPRPARPWRPCTCQLAASMSWLGLRYPLIRPGSRCPGRSTSRPRTARRLMGSITHPPTPRPPDRQGTGRPCWCHPHPGPTPDAKAPLALRIHFFTSRGFGVEEVNYAGSTGYGRAYRERLTGQWGVLDVADCLDAGHSLVQTGQAAGRQLVISGASAGGFTALCALAFHDLFAAGT